jgi:hypothetical protein
MNAAGAGGVEDEGRFETDSCQGGSCSGTGEPSELQRTASVRYLIP